MVACDAGGMLLLISVFRHFLAVSRFIALDRVLGANNEAALS